MNWLLGEWFTIGGIEHNKRPFFVSVLIAKVQLESDYQLCDDQNTRPMIFTFL